jgi:hypothetical protein
MIDYWREAVEHALEDADAIVALTDEQIASVADAMKNASENAGMADGRWCIPNPVDTEAKRAREAHEKEVKRLEAIVSAYEKDIARRVGVEPRQICVRDGSVWVSR